MRTLETVVRTAAPPRAPATVLLVDDEPSARGLFGRILASRGYAVIEACDGREALVRWEAAHAAGRRVDLLVTDVVMPGVGGRALASQLRLRQPTLPVLYLSGFADGVVHDGRAPTGFLAKPFTGAALADALAALREGARPR